MEQKVFDGKLLTLTKHAVVPVTVNCMCPACVDGQMIYVPDHWTMPQAPVLNVHWCNKCNHKLTIKDVKFPYIEYQNVVQPI